MLRISFQKEIEKNLSTSTDNKRIAARLVKTNFPPIFLIKTWKSTLHFILHLNLHVPCTQIQSGFKPQYMNAYNQAKVSCPHIHRHAWYASLCFIKIGCQTVFLSPSQVFIPSNIHNPTDHLNLCSLFLCSLENPLNAAS